MDIQNTLTIFNALSQETRLKVFRMLIKAGPKGLAAGKLSQSLDIAHNTMSFHLTHLCKAGIVQCQRDGRQMIYRADFAVFAEVITFMVNECCSPEFAYMDDDDEKQCAMIELGQFCRADK